MTQSLDIQKWIDYFKYDINQAASEFCELAPEEIAVVAESLGDLYLSDIVLHLETDAAADLLRNLPPEISAKILSSLPSDRGGHLREILSYAPQTAGALMAKEVLAVPFESTIGAAIHYLQTLPEDKKGKVSYIYVIDHNRRLMGVIQVRDLIFYAPERSVKEILKSPVVQVETGMSQLDVARLLQRHHYLGLPVVNEEQKLVGVISADTALKVFENEAIDDLAKMVGTSTEEFRTGSIGTVIFSRLPWLSVNIVSGLLCAYITGLFHKDFKTLATFFLFVPVVLGLSESAGIQGATIVVRNIAMGRVSLKHLRSLFIREAFVGICTGLACGVFVGSVATLWRGDYLLGIALGVSMAVAIIISASIGPLLPILFKNLKIDPAMASGPLVLAICDLQTLAIYFSISSAILRF